jgi:hypothetical protein
MLSSNWITASNIKRFIPTLEESVTFIRIKKGKFLSLSMAKYNNGWQRYDSREPIEIDGSEVTHFCLPVLYYRSIEMMESQDSIHNMI